LKQQQAKKSHANFYRENIRAIGKKTFINDKPFSKNAPTDKSFVIKDEWNFDKEKEQLKDIVLSFSKGDEEKCTTHPHSFFGKLTPKEWGIGMYKHLDHHLRQFGV
jgi:hypothetical protein